MKKQVNNKTKINSLLIDLETTEYMISELSRVKNNTANIIDYDLLDKKIKRCKFQYQITYYELSILITDDTIYNDQIQSLINNNLQYGSTNQI